MKKSIAALLFCAGLALTGTVSPQVNNKEKILQQIDRERKFYYETYKEYGTIRYIGGDSGDFPGTLQVGYDFDKDGSKDATADFHYGIGDDGFYISPAFQVRTDEALYRDEDLDGYLESKFLR